MKQLENNISLTIFFSILLLFLTTSTSFSEPHRSTYENNTTNFFFTTNSARTLGKGCYSVSLQGFVLQREYFVVNNDDFRVTKDNSTVIGLPISIGLTDYIDVSAGFFFFHDARPLIDPSDVYQYHGAPETGMGATHLGVKLRVPFEHEKPVQIAAKFGAMINTSYRQIDGMLYRWTRAKDTDYDVSLLESIDIGSFTSLHLKQGYIISGSDRYNDQITLGVGFDVHPNNRWSIGIDINNNTFDGASPQSLIKSIYDPFANWDSYALLGDPKYLKDTDYDFRDDYFVAIPSIAFRVNDTITLHAGAALNIADQRGPQEPLQIAAGITYNGSFVFPGQTQGGLREREIVIPVVEEIAEEETPLDDDGDGVPNDIDGELNTPRGNEVDNHGVSLPTQEQEVESEAVTYTIHVSSHMTLENAQLDVDRYRKHDFAASVLLKKDEKGGKSYRVIVGEYTSIEKARKDAKEMRNIGLTKYTNIMAIQKP